jgi:subtilase family serine protease
MVLVLKPDPVQQNALGALLDAQQDPDSPFYHQWLTPKHFGERFGISDSDLQQVVQWLEDKGFAVEPAPAGRSAVLFNGTAAQVESAFHTEIHVYNTRGQIHHANATDPEIPEALGEIAGGILSLHDFYAKPLHAMALSQQEDSSSQYTTGASHYLAPADFSTIYNIGPLYNSSTDGGGQTIAVAGRSNIKLSDVQSFRSAFALPANTPNLILNGPDPGILNTDEQIEAELDVEWAGVVARNASVQLVVSASTRTTDGVALSAQYIVNHNLAPVISLSFGSCEAAMGSAQNQFWNALWQQAAAQKMTVVVASGDSGAAGCDGASAPTATGGQAINGLCSSP